jgi:hypothetical protein
MNATDGSTREVEWEWPVTWVASLALPRHPGLRFAAMTDGWRCAGSTNSCMNRDD